VVADVVRSPPLPEGLAPHRQLADEVREPAAKHICRQIVAAHVADGRWRGDAVDNALHHRADGLGAHAAGALRRNRARGAREVEEMSAFGIFELERIGERFEDDV
jgi:hypothetical protein